MRYDFGFSQVLGGKEYSIVLEKKENGAPGVMITKKINLKGGKKNWLIYYPDYIKRAYAVFVIEEETGELEDQLLPGSAQTVPLGLILNEAVTNAIKYAFVKKGGEIFVGLQQCNFRH